MNLAFLLEERASRSEDETAIVFEGRRISFRSLFDEVRRTATFLEEKGVRPGDRVVLLLPKGIRFIVFHLAALHRGAVSLPLNDRFTAAEIGYFLDDSEAAACVVDKVGRGLVQAAGQGHGRSVLLDADDPARGAASPSPVESRAPAAGGDPAMIIYTSGTTGRPKGAVLSHANLVQNMEALRKAWQWTEADVLLHALPLFHVHGLVVALHGALNARSPVVMLDRFDPARVSAELGRSGCTLFMGVPTMYQRVVDLWETSGGPPDLSRLRLFISGSAPLSPGLFRRFRELTGQTILERYGMTETGMITSNPYRVEERLPGSVGYPLEGVEIRVVDGEGRPLPGGTKGEVQVRGPNVFRRYWKAEQKTAAAFDGGWFRTGDLGHLESDADQRLHLAGRCRELIISGGFNVYPREVEEVLERRGDIREAAVFGLPDSDLGERVAAVAVPARDVPVPDESELIAGCRQVLAGYKCPKRIFFEDSLPRNAMGKVQKEVLRGLFG